MEHTNEFLMGMFAAYRGCEVYSKRPVDKYYLKGLDISNDILFVSQVSDHWDGNTGDIREYRPLLTPLSEVTDEDKIAIAKIARMVRNFSERGDELARLLTSRDLIFDTYKFGGAATYINVVDYLRSKHYDLGYMHVPSLIQSGLAISSTTTK